MASITVKGMSCNHCKASVEKAMQALPGVSAVDVNLSTGEVRYEESTPLEKDAIRKAIATIGFEVV